MTTYEQWDREMHAIEAEIKRNMASAKKAKDAGNDKDFGIYDRAAESCRRERARLMKLEPPK